jgi:hypothetical protein
MPGKITDLAALTGIVAVPTDLIEAVDISDTSMAASGTNKRMTLAEMVVFFQGNGLGPVSGAGNIFPFLLNSTTNATGITGNQVRGNNGTFANSTKLWIMEITQDGLDVTVGLSRIKAGFQVYVQNFTNAAQYALFTATTDATDLGTHWEVNVAPVASAGTVPTGKIALQTLSTAQSNTLFSTTTTARGLAPGSNGAGATAYLDASGAWSTPAGGGAPVGTKLTAFTALTGTNAVGTDIFEVVDISDTTMASSGTNKRMTLAELVIYLNAAGITATIADNAVTQAKMADGSVGTAEIIDRNVTAVKQPQATATTFKGNSTGSTADIADISVYVAQQMLRRPVIANTATAFAPVIATHENTMVTLSNASPVVVTLPSDATSNFAIGAEVDFLWLGVGACSFAQGSSATIVSSATNVTAPVMRIRYSAATAKKIAANTWAVLGDLV